MITIAIPKIYRGKNTASEYNRYVSKKMKIKLMLKIR